MRLGDRHRYDDECHIPWPQGVNQRLDDPDAHERTRQSPTEPVFAEFDPASPTAGGFLSRIGLPDAEIDRCRRSSTPCRSSPVRPYFRD
jgi:hypothetical protein